jgi:hypothetical protein
MIQLTLGESYATRGHGPVYVNPAEVAAIVPRQPERGARCSTVVLQCGRELIVTESPECVMQIIERANNEPPPGGAR